MDTKKIQAPAPVQQKILPTAQEKPAPVEALDPVSAWRSAQLAASSPPDNPFRNRVQRMGSEQRIQTVLGLQRQIGNAATIALLRRKDFQRVGETVQRRAHLPKFGGGLASENKMNDFTIVFFRQVHSDAAETMTIPDFLVFIQRLVNGTLGRSQTAPLQKFTTEIDGDNYGTFNTGTWWMNINPKAAFGKAETVSQIDESRLKELADTIYHETRHAEQTFRVLRARAGAMIPNPDLANREEHWLVADKLRKQIAVPFLVALQAAENPLSPETKIGQSLVKGAMAWEKSMYGGDSLYRDFVLGKANENAKNMWEYASKLYSSVPDDYNSGMFMHNMPLSNKSDDFDLALKWIEAMFDWFSKKHIPEAERILAALRKRGKGSDTDRIMRQNLETILTAMRALMKTEGKLYTRNQIADLYNKAEYAVDVFQDAYINLPEESDAWRVGGKAGDKYEKQARKRGLDTTPPEEE